MLCADPGRVSDKGVIEGGKGKLWPQGGGNTSGSVSGSKVATMRAPPMPGIVNVEQVQRVNSPRKVVRNVHSVMGGDGSWANDLFVKSNVPQGSPFFDKARSPAQIRGVNRNNDTSGSRLPEINSLTALMLKKKAQLK